MAHKKTTSARVAKKASSILRSKSFSSKARSVAGSALTQKHKGRRR